MVDERELDREPGVLAIGVALGHLVLADPSPASRAPGHRVVALVKPPAPVALGQERPDEVVVLVGEGEVTAAEVRHSQSPDEHLGRIGDFGPGSARDRDLLARILRQPIAQATQLMRVVPVHPHSEPYRLLGLASRVCQDALLAEADEFGDAVGLDVALIGKAQVLLDVDLDPQPLAVEAVLVSLVAALHRPEPLEEILVGATPRVMDAHRVVGRDRAVQEAPALTARVLGTQAGECPALTPDIEDLVLLRNEIRFGADWSKHRPRCSEGLWRLDSFWATASPRLGSGYGKAPPIDLGRVHDEATRSRLS